MSVIKDLAETRPFVFVIALFIVESLVAVPFVAAFKLSGLDIVPLRLMIPVAQSLLMLGLIRHLGWFAKSGFVRDVRDVHVFWYPTLVAFAPVFFYGTVEITASWIVFYSLALIFTGLSEEAFARGIALPALLPRGKWVALIFAGALFSVGHFSNLVFENFGPLEMADKLLTTFGFAIMYGALFIRTGNIWPLIVLHAIHDYSYLVSGSAGPYLEEPFAIPLHMALSVANIAYGVFVAFRSEWKPVNSDS